MTASPSPLVAGRYRVQGLLGKGGMGEVFAANDERTGNAVALKVLHLETRHHATAVERLRREARAAAAIRSPFVTRIVDVADDPDRGLVLVFERLEGETLLARMKRTGPLSLRELWPIVEAIWVGLCDAHAQGIVHRDLKPSNVFLARHEGRESVKLLDFGTSKILDEFGLQTLTQLGQSLGTYAFMPPEQLGGARDVDARADIYAVATLIYLALSGRLPFQAASTVELMNVKASEPPRSLSDACGTPMGPQLETFLKKGLATARDDRFATSEAALDAWRSLRPIDAPSLVEPVLGSSTAAEPIARRPTARALTTRATRPWGWIVVGAIGLVILGFVTVSLALARLR